MKEQKDKAEIDKKKIYAQLLVDFANSKTTDEAGLGYLINLQKIYDFSSEFIRKAQADFPRMLDPSDPKHITNESVKILGLMDLENVLHSKINDFLEDGVCLLYYDYYLGRSLILNKTINTDMHNNINLKYLDHPSVFYLKNLRGSNINRYINKERYFHTYCKKGMKPKESQYDLIFETIYKWVETIKKLTEIRFGKSRHSNIFHNYDFQSTRTRELPESRFQQALGEHYHIRKCIDTLRNLLQAIVNNEMNIDDEVINNFIEIYNKIPKSIARISINLSVIIEKQFNEALFHNRDKNFILNLSAYYDQPIADCVVELLKTYDTEKKVYLPIIKKCINEKCLKFYVAERNITDQKFCSDKCRSAYHNSKKDHKEKVAEIVSKERAEGNYD